MIGLAPMEWQPGHTFWPAAPLLDERCMQRSRLLDPALVTHTCLLALAVVHKGKLAAFDRRMLTDAAVDGHRAYHFIE